MSEVPTDGLSFGSEEEAKTFLSNIQKKKKQNIGELCEDSEDAEREKLNGNTENHKWISKELVALARNTELKRLRGSYKEHEPYVIYTCKLPKDMKLWLRQNNGSTLIRKLIRELMNESGISVIPPTCSPSTGSLSSQSSHELKIKTVVRRVD